MNASRQRHLDEFYRLLDQLAAGEDGPRRLKDCTGRDGWPRRGVYFFLENGETRVDGTSRVVRVGTHALSTTSKHHHVGPATPAPRAGRWQEPRRRQPPRIDLPQARRDRPHPARRSARWTPGLVGQQPAPPPMGSTVRISSSAPSAFTSAPCRSYGSRSPASPTAAATGAASNATASRCCRVSTGGPDKPSAGWLGHHATSTRVRQSGLWNSNHVDEAYDPAFLQLFENLVKHAR